MPKTWLSPTFEKDFYPAENTGNRRFYRFSLDFFFTFRCFFTKNIVDSNSECFVKVAGTADFRAGKTNFLQFVVFYSIFHS